MGIFDSTQWRVAKDFVSLTPAIAWFVTCIAALPYYSALGWAGPIICAIFSAIICLWSVYDILFFKCPAFALVVRRFQGQNFDDFSIQEREQLMLSSEPLKPRDASIKVMIASAFAVTSIVFTIIFLAVGYGVIKKEEYHKPCDGECEGCSTDPNCSSWTERVMEKYPIAGICPPARDSADTNVTFSCLADGYWMVVTSIVGVIWAYCAYQINKQARLRETSSLAADETEADDTEVVVTL